jgi:membrane fusion protein, multidrug efflux system
MDEERTVISNPTGGPKNAPPKKHFHLWPWLLGGIILVIIIIAVLTHRHSAAAAAPRGRGGAFGPTMISIATAQKGTIGVYVNALGIVTPVYTVSVEARVAGQIVKVSYREGQRVSI